jgi:hypothetical protein
MRRKRSDSVTAQVEAAKRVADGAPTPPDFCSLGPEHMPFWNAIMNTKDYDMWTPNDLIVAASLARIQKDIETYAAMIRGQGRVEGDKVSPAHKVMIDLQGQQVALCRTLQIHARATHGESAYQAKKNKTFQDSRKKAQQAGNVMSLIKRS